MKCMAKKLDKLQELGQPLQALCYAIHSFRSHVSKL